jgi:hypothetical protein
VTIDMTSSGVNYRVARAVARRVWAELEALAAELAETHPDHQNPESIIASTLVELMTQLGGREEIRFGEGHRCSSDQQSGRA